MPIIDPSVQLALCTNEMETVEDNIFFLYYLYHASLNIDRSFESIEAYYQFKNDLISNDKFPNELFKFNYNFLKDFENPSIHNYYEYLLSKFRPEENNKISDIHRGQYFVYERNKHIGDKIIQSKFFRPVLTKSNFHAWYFTDSPVAILCVNLLAVRKQNQEKIITELELYLINLEIDLITAAGFTLVLSFITDSHSMKVSPKKKIIIKGKEKNLTIQEYFIYNTIITHNFSEIHFNLTSSEDDNKGNSLYDLIFTLVRNTESIDGHFYIYSPYFKDIKSSSDDLLNAVKVLKNKPRFYIFNFSDDIRSALDLGHLIGSSNDDYKCQPFPYLKTGFDQEKIRIMLCNVPVYSFQDREMNTMPSERSYLNWAYVSKDDFQSWSPVRVPIILDESNTHLFLERFVDSDDIHAVKPQFFVKDTLYLTRTSRDTLDTVNKIQEKSKDKTIKNQNINEYQQSKTYFSTKSKKIIKKLLTNVIYALQIHVGNIFLYKSQIFTAYEACQTCFSDEKTFNDKGFIYQVETGEGKSYIIRMIASVISLISQSSLSSKFGANKKMVHIASSNIQLANRDYEDSRGYFQSLGLESAVLLHQNELPYYNDEAKKAEMKNLYPNDFFKDELFLNSSNMNYSVCGINAEGIKGKKADIVFSTFVNFESLYLRMMETSTASVGEYFHNCYLLIDEADSILIDELANGTILSRTMKTNCNEVLKFVYKCKMENKKEMDVFLEVKKRWPKCRDLKLEDIKDMFDDIDLINTEEFTNGKKYSIETTEEEVRDKNIIQKFIEKSKKIKENVKDKLSKKRRKSSNKSENQDETEENLELNDEYTTSTDLSSFVDENKEDQDENNETDKKDHKKHHKKHHGKEHKKDHSKLERKKGKVYKIYKEIVPFDYDHKGVLEPNKEFSGFVQQFIAIKERTNNKDLRDLKIKDVSMNYLYVSHPIFVKLYRAVCGFTGTIGNKFEKQILKNQYQLVTKKIPRSKPNRRIELPIILCKDFEERNQKIANEVLEFHEKEYPVLVIFQDLNEITNVYEMLTARGIEFINIFDGKNEKVKPDFVSGRKGAVSLGTNVCGRGTDIKDPEKPLHVIISYYTSNSRVMQQAFGRTSRQGREGTVSIICLKDQFISPIEIMETDSMKEVLEDFQVKNEMQAQFIEDFRKNRSWIFDANVVKQKFEPKHIEIMRKSKINVNRIRAYDFEFPVCMSVQTFLIIQSQKIFSLYNCPNCLYTWILFQRYVRELILESWSLFIDRADKSFKKKKEQQPDLSYQEYLNEELKKIKPWLEMFLPNEKYIKIKDNKSDDPNKEKSVQRKFTIVETFMEIFEAVDNWGQKKIETSFPKKLNKFYSPNSKFQFLTFNVGFKPYSLVGNSGARISSIDGKEEKRNFISDPELKYVIFGSEDHFSITRKIDGIFESICEKINKIIGNYTGLKFFLRRTLSGCEFGVCFDFFLENSNQTLVNDSNCIIDKDPLFLFTIIIKSIVPILAAILIIGLVYIAKVAEKITAYITAGPIEITSQIVKKVAKEVAKEIVNGVLRYQVDKFCDKIVNYLYEILQKQLKTLNPEMKEIFQIMMNLVSVKDFENVGDKIHETFTEKICNIKMKSEFIRSFLPCGLPISHLLKIGLLLLLCFASFMMNFNNRKDQLEYKETEVASKYNKNQDTEQCFEENKNVIDSEDFMTVDLKK